MAQSDSTDKPQSGIRRKRKLAFLVAFLASLGVPWILSVVCCFLSLWIVIPAPTFSLLPLGIGAPEVSPWLVVMNGIALLLVTLRLQSSWVYVVALGCSLLGLLLSLLPLL